MGKPDLWIDCEVHVLPPEWCASGFRPPETEDVLLRVLYDHPERDRALAGASGEGLLREMEKAGIGQSVITGLPWRDAALNWRNNDELRRLTRENPGRFIPMGLLPAPETDDLVDAVFRMHGDYGFRGIKVIPSWQGWRLDDPAMFPVYEAMIDRGLVLMPHTDHAYRPDRGFDPAHRLFAVASRYPELKILAPHLGGLLALYGLYEPMRRVLDNILFVCSVPMTMRMTLYAADAIGADRIAFGTDFPFNPSHDQRTVRALFEALPMSDADQRAVAGGNARRFFGL